VFAPVVTQIGVGSAHCVLSRHCTQALVPAVSQMGSPGVVQSASTPHTSHWSPAQTGPPALPTQCVLFWHSTHIIVVTLQARFVVCVAQSASDVQRSTQVLLLLPMMQRLGGMQLASVKHVRHAPLPLTSQSKRGGFCILVAQCMSVRQA
jgi:hypothetical protein